MNKKIALVLIALIGVGLYALPQTVALFAGQHSFVNIDATGNQIDCKKCHGDVQAELDSGLSGTVAPHSNFKCEYCHRVLAGEASGDNAYSAITYTAGTAKRVLIVTERDMEARNIPINMTGTTVSATTLSGVAMGKNKVSACYNGSTPVPGGGVLGETAPTLPALNTCTAEQLLLTFTPPAARTFQATSLYESDGVTPKDKTDATKLGTFDASKVTYPNVCVQSTRSPYGWTCGPTASFNGSGSEVSNAGTRYHAASLVSCLECHGGEAPTGHHDAEYSDCNACHYAGGNNKGELTGIMAGGFGLGVTGQDVGDLEVHKQFVKNEDGVLKYEGGASNTACVACHTHVAVDISYDKPTMIVFDVTRNGNAFEVDTIITGGSSITYSGN